MRERYAQIRTRFEGTRIRLEEKTRHPDPLLAGPGRGDRRKFAVGRLLVTGMSSDRRDGLRQPVILQRCRSA